MNNAGGTPLRRINGRLQACDPCRNRKVACDHGRPVCLRCRKKKLDRNCVYTISPATLLPPKETSLSPSASSAPIQSSADNSASPSSGLIAAPITSVAHNSRAPGYLGYTSYSTVIEEARNSLSLLSGRTEDPEHVQSVNTPSSMSPNILQLALTVLNNVPNPEDGLALFRMDQSVYNDYILRIAKKILGSLYDQSGFGKYLGKERTVAQLGEMSQILSNNTAKPVLDHLDPDEWIAQFSGPNLRWESLGLLFQFWELPRSCANIQAPRPIRPNEPTGYYRKRDPRSLECLNLCISLCREFSDGNLFLIDMYIRRTTLESYVSGDASRQTWRYHAETVSSMTFIGLHAEPNDPFYKPSLQSELKRRIASTVYSMDTVVVAFTGRPPLLSRTFMTTPLPLDIKDDYLFGDVETLQARVADTLDEKGWSIEGGLYPSTYLRGRSMLAVIKGQITEIALSNGPAASVDDLLQLKAKLAETVAEFPQTLIYQPAELTDTSADISPIFTKLLLRLDHLQNEFFLGRLLLRRGYDAESDLLVTSFEIVVLTLSLWTHMDRFTTMRIDFEWLLVGFGAPAGGILCKELLIPTLHGSHPKNPQITRSSIVQKLSLLISFLDWPDPSAPNAELCGHCKSVIQRVLDQTLNPSPLDGHAMPDMLNANFSSTPFDLNFDLMDTFDWMRADI